MMRLMVPEQRSWPEPSPSRSPRPEGGLSKLERAVSKMLSPLGTESSNPSPSSGESQTNFAADSFDRMRNGDCRAAGERGKAHPKRLP